MKLRLFLALLIPTILSVLVIVIIWFQIVPKYQAKAEIRISPIIPRLVFDTEDNGLIPLYNSYLNTEVSIVRSNTVLQRVLDRPEIHDTNWYKSPEDSFISTLWRKKITLLERLRENLSVTPRNETEIVDVSFLAPDAEDAQIIVNAVLEDYIQYISEKSDETGEKIYNQLVGHYNSLEHEIKGREHVIDELYERMGTWTPQELISNKRIQLDETKAKLTNIQQEIAILQWQLKDLNNIANLEPELNKAKLEFQLAQAQYEEELINTDIKHQKQEYSELFQMVRAIESENKQLKRKRDLFDAVQRRLDEKNMERNVPGTIEVLARASLPSKPYSDNRILYTIVTLVLWLGISSFIIIIPRIRSDKGNKSQMK